MLQKLRDQTQGTGFKILVGAIIVVLTLFGFGATNLFMGADPTIAEVGDLEITQSLLAVETEREKRRLLGQMGPEFDPSSIDTLQLQQYALQQMISRQVLYQTAAEMGIRVTPENVNEQLVNGPAYQVDGQFNEAIYRQQLQAMGFSPVEFIDEITDSLSAEQLRQGVEGSSLLTDWELSELIRVLNQQRDIAYLPLTVDQFQEQVEVTEDEITLRYNENQFAYMTDLLVDVSYLHLKAEDLAGDASIVVDEDALVSLYEDERALALADEQRDSAHILVQVSDGRSAEEALEMIEQAQSRLASGDAFATVAAELSEDPGSAAQGGELGPAGKGIFDPAFEDALWALETAGDVSEPVLTSFGYHLIRLNNIIEPDYPAFDTQRMELEQRFRQIKAEELFLDRALELERAAYEERFALDNTAAELGLEVQKSVSTIGRNTPSADEVLGNVAVLDALFSPDVLEGTNSEALELGEGEVVIVRVDQQYPPEAIPLADVTESIAQEIAREKALAEIANAKAAGLARLQAGDNVAEIAASLGSQWRSFSLLKRSGGPQDIPPAVRVAAFDLPRPAEGEKSVSAIDTDDGAALVTVTRVVQGDINTTTDAEVAEIRRLTAERVARFDMEGFFRAAEQRLNVSRPSS